MKPTLPMLAIPLTLAASAWILWPSQAKSLRVAVHEGKVRMETPKGNVEVPAGRVARADGAAPFLMAEAEAEEGWRKEIVMEAEGGRKYKVTRGDAPAESPDTRLRKRLIDTTVHFQFEGVNFEDAKKYIEVQGRVAINVDKAARDANPELDDSLIQLRSPKEGMPLESALDYLTKAVGLAWECRDGCVAITSEARKGKPGPFVAPAKPIIEEIQIRLSTQVHCKFEDVAFGDAKTYLEMQGRVVINVDRAVREANPALDDTRIRMASPEEGMPLEGALNGLCDAIGAKWTVKEDGIVIMEGEGDVR